ncbi:unnamed protein product [Victoria cruziana]
MKDKFRNILMERDHT